MKVHTTAFKEQIKEMGRELDSIITFGDTVLGAEELNAVTPSFQGAILKSVMKQLDIDSNVEIPVGTELNYKFGVKVNEEYEYLDFGNYIVKDVEKQEDTMSYKITCYDKMMFTMQDYVKMPITYPITIRDYINSLCLFLGISFANNGTSFVNFNKKIDHELYLDASGNSIGYTFRDVFDELAQVTASTICINDNDQLEIRYIKDTYDTIDEEFLKNVNVNFGEKYGKINSIVLSRSGESDNIYLRDETSVEENGLCELKIVDNQIMNWNDRSDNLPEILNKLNGLEYYLNDFASTGITYYDLCDRYNVVVGEQTYSCVMFNDEILVTQGLEENVFTEMPEETKTDYTKADKTDRKINQTYLIVDKQNQQIESVISQTDEQNQKIAQVTQTVEELNSKISDIADITISGEDNDAQVELNNINQSEPIRIVVRPIGESISYLYPHNNLFPSDNLFSKNRKIRFTNKSTEETFDYELPDNLLYYNSENYDEFILDYDGQSCVINKKVGYNTDGTTYVLDTPTTLEFEYSRILLTDGDYTISVLGYENAYLFARLMAQNIYTTQFATKAELNSEISQTSQEINLSVDKKLESYSTTTEMNSAIQITANGINQTVSQKIGKDEVVSSINQSAEQITLTGNRLVVQANNFKLDANGNMQCSNANITGGNLKINSDHSTPKAVLTGKGYSGNSAENKLVADGMLVSSGGKILINQRVNKIISGGGTYYGGSITLSTTKDNSFALTEYDGFSTGKGGTPNAFMYSDGEVYARTYSGGSLESIKKNINLYSNSALNVIKNSDIYEYNLKDESDEEKKHIGLVISDGYKKYKTPQEIISKRGDGVDL